MSETVVITGASDGIGAAAARALNAAGKHVVLVGRSPQKTAALARELHVDHFLADFARLDQVHRLASELLLHYPQIDVLANNAGGIFGRRELTVDGHELTFQVNHLAPFLLTTLLMDRLVHSKARVINTSSVANTAYARLDADDLETLRDHSPNRAYGNSKLANILFTQELARRFGDTGLTTASFHPGVVRTNFANDSTSPMRMLYRSVLGGLLLSPEKGADTLVWLATTQPGVDWVSGEYYVRRKLGRVNTQADDPELAKQLWDRSAQLVSHLPRVE
jgi:NAD(P)-dependent dehydrogenase (short-subunit alcohol dehydrogenase family)